ncbi:MAG: signal peptide peptidase SppA [Pirellulales bacterium]|nr:signal peptide peptidase SppA [Pirellulales bacterium]
MDPQPQPVPPSEIVVPTMVPERPAPPPPRPPRRSYGCLALILGAGLVLSLLLNFALSSSESFTSSDSQVTQKYHSLARFGRDKVAIIEVAGPIMDGDSTKRAIDAAKDDKHIKAVVLRVDSPGGTVSASDYIYHHLSELAKEREIPIVVSMGGIAASGGYYISMAVGDTPGTIFAEPSTWTGSIGVIIPHYDFSGLLSEYKVSEDSIKSHRLKAIGSVTKPMTEEERALLQGLVDDGFDQFKEVVKSGRPRFAEHPDQLDAVATGQVYTAKQAKEHGLVDEIGYIEEAIERALELAKLDKKKTKVVELKPQLGLFEQLLMGPDAQARSSLTGLGLSQLLDLTSPRAYYMFTWLPALGGIARP